MSARDSEFDDPGLRAAVRRSVAQQPAAAPPSLRLRVESLLESSALVAAAASAPAATARWRWPTWAGESPAKTLIAAAAALIALVIVGVQIWSTLAPDGRPRGLPPVPFPVSVAAEMVRTHDNCARLPDHHLVPGNDPAAVVEQLSKAQGVTVAMLSPGNGWQFKGAGLCKVGDAQAAHLLYARGDQLVSVFSLKGPSNCAHGTSAPYQQTIGGHPMSGFLFSGTVYGVVASSAAGGQISVTDIAPLAAQVETCVGASSCEGIPPTTRVPATVP